MSMLGANSLRRSAMFGACVGLTVLVVAAPLGAQTAAIDKNAIHSEMLAISAEIEALKPGAKERPDVRSAMEDLRRRYEALSASLGGDDPAYAGRLAGAPSVRQRLVGPVPSPPGCTAQFNAIASTDTPVPIVSNQSNTSSITVAGVGIYLLDVEVLTQITHTFASDLDITLTSPAGTVVTLSTDNGGGNDDVFDGTRWEDDPGATPTTETTFANNVTAGPLIPEEALGAFIGEDPNGVWTLDAADDAGGDTGEIASWTLELVTLPVAPSTALTSVTSSDTPVAITDNTTVTSDIVVGGASAFVCKAVVTTEITHTFASDLDITLSSPASSTILTTDNGGGNDNVFDGTVWDDDGGDTNPPGAVTDATFANNVTETPIVPEGAMGGFVGENPNGTWTLAVGDDAGGDTGSIDSWTLDLTLCSCTTVDLEMAKTGAPEPVMAGSPLVYTLTASHVSGDTATNVTVMDPLPAEVTWMSDDCGAGPPAGNLLTWNVGTLMTGGSAVCNVTVMVGGAVAAPFTNTATVSSTEIDTNSSNNSASFTSTIMTVLSSDLRMAKSGAPEPVTPGGSLVYTLTVTNDGPDPNTGVVVTDPLPAEVTWVSDTCGAGPPAGNLLTWNVGALAASASIMCNVTVTVDAGTAAPFTNTATVAGDNPDPDSMNDSASFTSTIATSDLEMMKTGAPEPVPPGANLVYTLSVTNNGPDNDTGVVVTDPLPAEVTWVSDTCGAGPPAGNLLTWNVGALAVSATIMCNVTVTVDAGTTASFTNTATVAGENLDPDSMNDSASFTSTIATSDLEMMKTGAPEPVTPGADLVYTLTVTNNGPDNDTGVVVTDTLPTEVTWVSDTCGAGPPAGNLLTWNVGALAASASIVCNVTVTVDAGTTASFTNTATVAGENLDPTAANDSASFTSTIAMADLSLDKTVTPENPQLGDEAVYTLTVTNNGPDTATNTVVIDDLPAEVEWVTDDCGAGPPAGGPPNGMLTWTVGDLANGASATCNVIVDIVANPGGGTPVTNNAIASSDAIDPVPDNDTSSASVTVVSVLDIPTLGTAGLAGLSLLLMSAAWLILRRRRV